MSFSEIQKKLGTSFQSGASLSTGAFPGNNTAGNFILVSFSWGSGSITVTGVSDTQGNTYTLVAGPTVGNSSGQTNAVYLATNIKAGANTITASLSGSAGGSGNAWAIEFNCSTGTAVSKRSSASAIASSGQPDSGAATAVAGDLQYASQINFGGTTTSGTGYTAGNNPGGSSNYWADEYILNSAGGAVHGTFSGVSLAWICQLVNIAPPSPNVANAIFSNTD